MAWISQSSSGEREPLLKVSERWQHGIQNVCEVDCSKARHLKPQEKRARNAIITCIVIALFFMAAEFVGGWLANSVAIFSDGLHMLSDIAGLLLSLIGMIMGSQSATDRFTFGFKRFEIVSSLLSILSIWAMAGVLLSTSISRLKDPPYVNGKIMLVVACIGMFSNFVMAFVLHIGGAGHAHGGGGHGHSHESDETRRHSHSHASESGHGHAHGSELESEQHGHSHTSESGDNINIRSALLHVIGDFFQNIGVIIAAGMIWYNPKKYRIVDPLCTIVFAVATILLSLRVIRDAGEVLMDMSPRDVDLEKIRKRLCGIRGVTQVHDLHCWYVAYGEKALSCHIRVNADSSGSVCTQGVLKQVKSVLSTFGIEHTTIQIEDPDHSPDDHVSLGRQPAFCVDHQLGDTPEMIGLGRSDPEFLTLEN